MVCALDRRCVRVSRKTPCREMTAQLTLVGKGMYASVDCCVVAAKNCLCPNSFKWMCKFVYTVVALRLVSNSAGKGHMNPPKFLD